MYTFIRGFIIGAGLSGALYLLYLFATQWPF